MKSKPIDYKTIIQQRRFENKLFVMETIRDLDEAIDQICEAMSDDEKLDPFAEDLSPYFGILWPAAEGLSQYLFENPDLVKKKTVLELGSGLGYPSMMATYLGGKVLTTDYHPDVEEFFKRNCRHSVIECEYKRFNWREKTEDIGVYDVVMGSDILYESKHPKEVAQGLLRFVKKGGVVLLADPGRAYLQNFVNAMNELGYREELVPITIKDKDIFLFKFEIN
jgi:predicted nicotinamide N-methyase